MRNINMRNVIMLIFILTNFGFLTSQTPTSTPCVINSLKSLYIGDYDKLKKTLKKMWGYKTLEGKIFNIYKGTLSRDQAGWLYPLSSHKDMPEKIQYHYSQDYVKYENNNASYMMFCSTFGNKVYVSFISSGNFKNDEFIGVFMSGVTFVFDCNSGFEYVYNFSMN
jgi:hypothetical protein